MIAHHIGVQGDVSKSRLPADAFPAVFAYSLNRKLRAGYNGNYFKFRQADGTTGNYPADTPDLGQKVYIETIYDQKAREGVETQDAVQSNQSLQPELTLGSTLSVGSKVRIIRSTHPWYGSVGVVVSLGESGFAMDHSTPKDGIRETDGGVTYTSEGTSWELVSPDYYRAQFNNNEYLEVENLAPYIGQNFTITCLGKCSNISPMLGIWGTSTEVTIEPSEIARFTFDSTVGALLENSAGQPMSYYSGISKQNNRIVSITSSSTEGMTIPNATPSFSDISIGRSASRKYKGYFVEATMHLGDLTNIGRDQILQTTRNYYL